LALVAAMMRTSTLTAWPFHTIQPSEENACEDPFGQSLLEHVGLLILPSAIIGATSRRFAVLLISAL
jgi:hypothetical protein